jgi:hypothetical protein
MASRTVISLGAKAAADTWNERDESAAACVVAARRHPRDTSARARGRAFSIVQAAHVDEEMQ